MDGSGVIDEGWWGVDGECTEAKQTETSEESSVIVVDFHGYDALPRHLGILNVTRRRRNGDRRESTLQCKYTTTWNADGNHLSDYLPSVP